MVWTNNGNQALLHGRAIQNEHIQKSKLTVPMAKIAPSAVDMEAATIPIKHQAPRKAGASCVKSLMKAESSGIQAPQVGRPRMSEHVSASN